MVVPNRHEIVESIQNSETGEAGVHDSLFTL